MGLIICIPTANTQCMVSAYRPVLVTRRRNRVVRGHSASQNTVSDRNKQPMRSQVDHIVRESHLAALPVTKAAEICQYLEEYVIYGYLSLQ
jgi:hypothetical protein